MICPNPRCRSTDIASNHIPEGWMDGVAHAARVGHQARSPVMTFGGMALWGAMKAVNSLRSRYRCNRCGATFDA